MGKAEQGIGTRVCSIVGDLPLYTKHVIAKSVIKRLCDSVDGHLCSGTYAMDGDEELPPIRDYNGEDFVILDTSSVDTVNCKHLAKVFYDRKVAGGAEKLMCKVIFVIATGRYGMKQFHDVLCKSGYADLADDLLKEGIICICEHNPLKNGKMFTVLSEDVSAVKQKAVDAEDMLFSYLQKQIREG